MTQMAVQLVTKVVMTITAFNFLYLVNQFFTIKKARVPNNEVKPCWVSG